MHILVTICGRSGSKGVKNKNIRDFLGYPLIEYTIAAAELFKAKRVGDTVDICINSDSAKILSLAAAHKEIVKINRPNDLAGDLSSKISVIVHSVEHMEKTMSISYDVVIDLDITSPLRRVSDITNTLESLLSNEGCEVVLSVVPARRNPYFNMIEVRDGVPRRVINTKFITRQEAPEVYDVNASVYCYRRKSLGTSILSSPIDGVFGFSMMQDTGVLDIDTEEDFQLMEVVGRHFFMCNGYSEIMANVRKYTACG